ncbi:unnamed protein product [Orchesella dallaii]|uniref:Uncharacterized protein n=1 Tax=Orchesella dallaii TaxID=48710 RepID=A0ABP1R1I9_9HEXA
MSLRRGSAKLKTLGRSHAPLHMLLWQAREAQSTLLAAASAQKTLFSDIAAWASTENRALNDVCSCASELSTLYSGALSHLAYAFKTFRKEVSLVLEGEKRCDLAQKRLQDAEQKRIKLRRQVLRAQNKTINEGQRQAGDFTQLQTQLAEAERTAERAHVESCDAAREQEAVKLVVMRNSLTKLSQQHVNLGSNCKLIFEGNCELCTLLPEPPPPGDPLSCIRYTGYDQSKEVVEKVKRQVNLPDGLSPNRRLSSNSSIRSSRPLSSSTPVSSPNTSSSMWSPEPSAPRVPMYSPGGASGQHEPPPPYNTSYLRWERARMSYPF